jgi:hypothetical protein
MVHWSDLHLARLGGYVWACQCQISGSEDGQVKIRNGGISIVKARNGQQVTCRLANGPARCIRAERHDNHGRSAAITSLDRTDRRAK